MRTLLKIVRLVSHMYAITPKINEEGGRVSSHRKKKMLTANCVSLSFF